MGVIRFCTKLIRPRRLIILVAALIVALILKQHLSPSTDSLRKLLARYLRYQQDAHVMPGAWLLKEASTQTPDLKWQRTTLPATTFYRRSTSRATTTTTTTPFATSTPQTSTTAKPSTQGQTTNSSMSLRDQMNAKLRYFKPVEGQRETFLYSAIANFREPNKGQLNIIVNAFDSTNTSQFTCCIYLHNDSLVTTQGQLYYTRDLNRRYPKLQIPRQYACVLDRNLNASYVTLTSSSCPSGREKYLRVDYQQIVPEGVAICCKLLYGSELNPNRLLEWFEVQRLLGVDRILILDLDNPEPIQRVFQHYVKMGFVEVHPYELPGPPYGRGMHESQRTILAQFLEDEQLAVFNCRQRLGGFKYILTLDSDEVLLPAQNQTVKAFLDHQFKKRKDAAGFVFKVQFFFLFEWLAVDNSSDITFLRFLNGTMPIVECYKHAYRPDRVFQSSIHGFLPYPPYKSYNPGAHEATLHHYRKCTNPTVWKTCNYTKVTDREILRFKGILEDKVKAARKAIGISPLTHPLS